MYVSLTLFLDVYLTKHPRPPHLRLSLFSPKIESLDVPQKIALETSPRCKAKELLDANAAQQQ